MSSLIEFINQGWPAENDFVSRLGIATALVLGGLLVAYLIRVILERVTGGLLRFLARRYPSTTIGTTRVQQLSVHVLPRIVFWFIVVLVLAAGTETLGLPLFTAWLAQLMNYLPSVMTATLILFGGLWLGVVLKQTVSRTAAAARLPYARVLGGLCRTVVIATAGVIAINQLGIDLSFLTILVGVVVGSLVLAVTLAFGMGAHTMVSNIISCHYISGLYRIGNVIEINGVKGTIVNLTGAFVLVETESGVVTIPAKEFSQSMSTQSNPS